ncbi:DUF7507 domain-containing protein [Flavobacterium faecale]|uniref:DUF7507 domain-containing protein n=1 Tax=Flavobacterium faecale TaxID=1355330 RepID=UPI003AAAF212
MRKNYPVLSIKNCVETIRLRSRISKLLTFLSILLLSFNSYGQCNSEIPIPLTGPNFDDLTATASNSALICIGCSTTNPENLVDNNTSNFATAQVGLLSAFNTQTFTVTDNNTVYQAGSFAGFKVQSSKLLDLLGGITVKTYNGNTLANTFTSSGLLSLLDGGNYILGGNTTLPFNKISIEIQSIVGVATTTNIFHAVIREYCAGIPLDCNTSTAMSLPSYPVIIDQANTGLSGVSVGSIANTENAISSSTTDYATINLTVGVLASGSIAIKDQITDYPVGTYAGFEIENTNLVSLSAIGNVVVSTYRNGIYQEQFSGSNLLVNGSVINSTGRYKLGFVTTKSFDEVKLTVNQTLGLNLGTTRVYGAVFQKFCAGPDLVCNTKTALATPTYPVYVNGENTGIDGIACVLCSITNQDNLIDTDPANFAAVNLSVGVGTSGSLSVKDQITDYPAGTFAGYSIENPSLLNVNAFDAIRITTYLNGVQQETKSGNGALVSVGTDLLVGTSKQTIGFTSTLAFDEVQITFENLASVNLGTVKVFNAVFQKLCDPVVECNKTYDWTNPAFPVVVNGDNTGVDGVACVACAVNDTDNLLTASTTDFAQISLTAGVLASGSVSVKDQLFTYPKGTFAGFKIFDNNTLLQLNLFQSLTISTYNNGVLQEAKSGGSLIDLGLLGGTILGSGPGGYNVGLSASLPFDEIKLTVSSIASVINTINVYGAFVNTSNSDDGGSGSLQCNSSAITVAKDGNYVDTNLDGIVNPGDQINYTFDIKNTGFETLTNVTLTDDNATVIGSPIPTLTAGENNTTAYTGTYTITQADVDAGVVYNLATVTGDTPFGTTVTATSTDPTPCAPCPVNPTCATCTATPLDQTPKLGFVKSGIYNGDPTKAVAGDIITYTFTVTNTGNVTIDNVVVNDTKLGVTDLAIVPSTLAPNGVGVVIQNYVVTQGDIDSGKVTNSAIAKGLDPKGNEVQDISGTSINTDDSTVTDLPTAGKIVFVKTGVYNGDPTKAKVGDKITYTFTVTNTGNVTVDNLLINDTKLGITDLPLVPTSLNPLGVGVATQDYTITQADIDTGQVTNSAIALGKDPDGNNVQDISGTTIANDDSTITNLPTVGSLAFVKTAVYNGDPTKAKAGDKITYTFRVTNTGNLTVNNIVINDAKLGVTNLPLVPNSLSPLGVGVVTQDYTITQADIDAGKVTNTAIALGQDPSGNDVQDISGTAIDNDNSTETNLPTVGGLAFVKTAVYNGDPTKAKAGDKITYTFTVTNTGNLTVNNIVINDAKLGVTNLPLVPSSLSPLRVGVVTQDYTITQADIDTGQVTNTAIALGQDPQGNDVQDISGTAIDNDNSTETNLPTVGGLAFVKTAVYNGDPTKAKAGDKITYTFRVTNTGNLTVNNIVINDAKLGVTNLPLVPNSLSPLGVGVVTQDYTITQADIDAGKVTNTAIALGQDPSGNDVQDISGTAIDNDNSTETNLPTVGGLAFVKTAVYNGDPTKAKAGDKITYTFTVTNTGNLTVNNIVINDAKLGVTNLPLVPSSLSPLRVGVVTQDYTITQADIDTGQVTNTAIALGQDPQGNDVQDISGTAIDNDNSTETNLPTVGGLAFVKTAVYNGDPTKAKAGDKITYTFTVTNTGNLTVNNIVINDAKLGVTNLPLVPNSLSPLGVGVVTQDYTITQADIDAGKVTNTAIALGQDPQGNDVQDISGTAIDNDNSTETNLPTVGGLAFVKTAVYNGDPTKAKAGDKITYTFTVTNTGNLTVNNIVINDAKLGVTNLPLVPNSLSPLGVGVVTQDYTITQVDIDTGQVTNTAIALGQDPQGNDVQDTSGTAIDNDDSTVTNLPTVGGLAFVKTAVYNGDPTKAKVGDKITYTFTVTNIGNLTVNNIVINDPKLGVVNLPLVPSTLTPLGVGVATQEYTVTQGDIDSGKVTNSAIAKGQDPSGNDVQDISGTTVNNDVSTVTDLPTDGKIVFVKTGVYNGDPTKAKAGDKITYTFTVTNTGNVTVNNLLINDTKLGVTNLPLVPNSLSPLEVGIATQDYTITQADIDAGKVTNTAIALGQDPDGNNVQDTSGTAINNDDSTVTDLPTAGKIVFVKTAVYNGDPTKAKAGDKITYTFTVTNTGNLTVNNIVINDAKLGVTNLPLVPNSLSPLGVGVVTQDYTITQADIDARKVTNTAIALGQDPQGNDVQDISGTAVDNDNSTETNLPTVGSLAFVKTAVYNGDPTKAKVGDKITYTFTVTNTGNVTVSNIIVNDAKLGTASLAIVPSTLAPLGVGIATQEYTITQEDIDSGEVTNTAIAKGQDPQGNDVQDTSGTAVDNDDSTITNIPQSGAIAFVKTGVFNGDATKAKVGDKITYTFTVTNTGNVTVSNIVVNDAKLGTASLAIVPSNLAPLGVGVATQEYTITQEDIDSGKVTNTAIAKGKDPQGNDVQDISGTAVDNDDSTETTLPQNSSIALVKTVIAPANIAVGQNIVYTFSVTNTGNTTIKDIKITDPLTGLILPINEIAILAPGQTNNSVTGTYPIKQLDINAGEVVNSALAVGKNSEGNDVSDISGTTVSTDDPTITKLVQSPSIVLTKDGVYEDTNADGKASIGDKVLYVFEVKNTGNTIVNDVMVTDAKAAVQGTMIPSLGVGISNSTTFKAEYFITQEDINKGFVYNLAHVDAKAPNGDPITNTSIDPTINSAFPIDISCPTCTITAIPQSPRIALMMTGVFEDTNGDGQAQIGETIRYTYTVMNLGNVPLTNVWVEDTVLDHGIGEGVIDLPVGATDNTSFTSVYYITQNDIIKGFSMNQSKVFGTSPLGVIVQDLSDDTSPFEDDPTVIGVVGCDLKVFNAVSPDGDGLNDYFRIEGIDCYPDNKVQIFDRWGVKVFEVKGYDNDTKAFRGKSDGRVTIGQSNGLPSGTYFYAIKYVDKNNNGFNKSGYLQLINE